MAYPSSAGAAKKRKLSPPSSLPLAPLFRRADPTQGTWLPSLGAGKGCGHFQWRHPDPSTKIAAFDIDGTLITPQAGRKFPKNDTDWQWLNPHVVPRLRKLHADGFAVVLFSNQGLHLESRIQHFKRKMPLLARALDIPLRMFAAFEYNEYRKPAPGMWRAFEHRFNGTLPIDHAASFYVGDAAGRPLDHSDTDYKFALNSGLRFLTPEEFFFDLPPPPMRTLSGWDSREYDHSLPLYTPCSPPLVPRKRSEFDDAPPPEVILFVGYPGVGKTSFYQTYFAPHGYVHVNQDTLKTRQACLDLVRSSLTASSPRSVVVDNTSPSVSVRAEYLALVRSLGDAHPRVRVRCFHFTAPIQLALHNSVYRALQDSGSSTSGAGAAVVVDGEGSASSAEAKVKGKGKAMQVQKKREVLPLAAFMAYQSKLEVPTLEEGFDEVKQIRFRFDGNPEQLSEWQCWLGDIYGYKPPTAAAAAAAAAARKLRSTAQSRSAGAVKRART